MNSPGRVLVVGADGLIGTSLMMRAGVLASGTSRRDSQRGLMQLDLADTAAVRACRGRFDLVFLCAALTGHERCARNPALGYQVNVKAPYEIARNTWREGAHVVFLSTDSVFGDAEGARGETDCVAPGEYVYPALKAEAERVLIEGARDEGYADRLSVVRLTKVMSVERDPFRKWLSALAQGCDITPLTDLMITPISLKFATDSLWNFARERRAGVLHLSGARDVSYAELARGIANRLGLSYSVKAIRAEQAGVTLHFRPRTCRLDMTRTTATTGVSAQSLEHAIGDLLDEWNTVRGTLSCAIGA